MNVYSYYSVFDKWPYSTHELVWHVSQLPSHPLILGCVGKHGISWHAIIRSQMYRLVWADFTDTKQQNQHLGEEGMNKLLYSTEMAMMSFWWNFHWLQQKWSECPKNYAHNMCLFYVVVIYLPILPGAIWPWLSPCIVINPILLNLPILLIFFMFNSLALAQFYDCHNANEITINDMGK